MLRAELLSLLKSLPKLQPDELPTLLGELEEVRAHVWLRMNAPAPAQSAPDTLLSAGEAALRLGRSKDYVYRHANEFPFTRRMPGGGPQFSARGIEAYISKKTA